MQVNYIRASNQRAPYLYDNKSRFYTNSQFMSIFMVNTYNLIFTLILYIYVMIMIILWTEKTYIY